MKIIKFMYSILADFDNSTNVLLYVPREPLITNIMWRNLLIQVNAGFFFGYLCYG